MNVLMKLDMMNRMLLRKICSPHIKMKIDLVTKLACVVQ